MKLITSLLMPVTFCLNISAIVGYRCEGNAPQKAMRCIETLFPTAQQSGPMGYGFAWDYGKMKAACTHSTISLSVFCVRSVMDQCRDNPTQLALLHKYFDTERMQAGLYRLCDQLDEAREYLPCMQAQLQGFMQCAQDKLGVFEDRTKLAGGDGDKIIAASCSFINIVYECQATAVRVHCGEFPARFVLQIMNAFRPPSCQTNGANELSTRGAFGLKLPLLIFASALSLVAS